MCNLSVFVVRWCLFFDFVIEHGWVREWISINVGNLNGGSLTVVCAKFVSTSG